MKKIPYLEHDCKIEFVGDESSLNHLRKKISEMIKNKQENCFQFLLDKKYEEMEEGDYRYSLYCGFVPDHNFTEFEFQFNNSSIILKFFTCCLLDTLPYISDLCVKYKVDCKMGCRCDYYYDCYDFYILYKTGKYKYKTYSLTEGAYRLNPSSIYEKIKGDLIYDIRKNQIDMNTKDIYLNRYKYLKQKEKKWMLELIDGIVASYSIEIFTNELPKATASI